MVDCCEPVAEATHAAPATPAAARTGSRPGGDVVAVRAWLFGALATLAPARPVVLHFPPGFTAGDVIEALAARCGPGFLDQVLCPSGELYSCCKVFADGLPVAGLDAPLGAGGAGVEVEMILLAGYEGG